MNYIDYPNTELINRVKNRSSSLREETINKLNISKEEFETKSFSLNDFAKKVLNGESDFSEFHQLNDTDKLIAVMTVCNQFANQLDSSFPSDHETPPNVDNVTSFLEKVPSELALIGLRVEVCVERMITWNLDLLPQFSSIIENIHKMKSSSVHVNVDQEAT